MNLKPWQSVCLMAAVLAVGLALDYLLGGGHLTSIAFATVALAATNPTLLDVAKRTGPDGSILPLVEALQQRNGLLQTMVWKTGNRDTGHEVARRNALPAVSWVRINEGVSPGKSTGDTYSEGCGILESLSSIDRRLVEINGNSAAFRASEDDAFLAAMSNELERALFYENTQSNPERIMGLTFRLNSTTGAFGKQILKADASAGGNDQTSIWLIGWGDRTVYGISPRGSGTGLEMQDKGEQRTLDSNSKVIYKYETLFRWKAGFCVEDYRYVVRVCNIDTSRLTVDASSGADLIRTMVNAYWQIYNPQAVRLAWYCNRTVGSFLHQQALSKTYNSTLTIEPAPMIGAPGIFGAPILKALGAPILISDALNIAESPVT